MNTTAIAWILLVAVCLEGALMRWAMLARLQQLRGERTYWCAFSLMMLFTLGMPVLLGWSLGRFDVSFFGERP